MTEDTMFYLENITRAAFEAGRSRGMYEAVEQLQPEHCEQYYRATGQDKPQNIEDYITTIKAGLIMRNSGLA
jgi:hypothetical protein